MRYTLRVLISLILCVGSLAARAQNTSSVGNCVAIYIQGQALSQTASNFCSQVPTPAFSNGLSVQQVYAWVPAILADAYSEAERGLSGRLAGVTGQGSVTLIVFPSGLADAQIRIDQLRSSAGNTEIFINTGLIDFIEAISSSYLLDALRGQPDALPGLGFAQWIATLPPAPRNSPISQWALAWPGPAPIPSGWQAKYLRPAARSVYTFVYSHELSHLALGLPSGGATPTEILRRESQVDLNGFHHIGVASPYRTAMSNSGEISPSFIIATFAAMARFLHARANNVAYMNGQPSGTPITDMLPAADWVARGRALVQAWKQDCQGLSSSTMCISGVASLHNASAHLLDMVEQANQ